MKLTTRMLPWSWAALAALVLATPTYGQEEKPAEDKPAEAQAEKAAEPEAAEAAKQEAPAAAEGDKEAEAQAAPEEAPKEDGNVPLRKLKIFELKHRSPQEIQQIVSLSTRPVGAVSFTAATAAGFTGQLPPTLTAPPSGSANAQPAPLVASDAEKKLLLVRGNDEQIQQIEQIVNAFDVAESSFTSQQFGDVMLIKVEDGNAGRVHGVLNQLHLQSEMVHLGSLSLIAIPTGSSEAAKAKAQQAQEVIAVLQKKKEEPKPEEAKTEEAKADEAKAEEAKKEEAKAEEAKPAEEEKKEEPAEEKKEEEKKDEEKKD